MKHLYLLLFLVGCSTVTMKPSGLARYEHKPDYSETQKQYLWGLISDNRIDAQAVCLNEPVLQLQTRYEPQDVLLNIVTLGIYSPRTAKIWCKKRINSGKPISNMKKNKG